jgi:serine/threonine protein kinase
MGDFRYSSYYFIDMELCDLSLQGYLYPDPFESYTAMGLPPSLQGLPPASVADHICNIMRQIANGLKFIHAHSEAHRDLKPSNGNQFSVLN